MSSILGAGHATFTGFGAGEGLAAANRRAGGECRVGGSVCSRHELSYASFFRRRVLSERYIQARMTGGRRPGLGCVLFSTFERTPLGSSELAATGLIAGLVRAEVELGFGMGGEPTIG